MMDREAYILEKCKDHGIEEVWIQYMPFETLRIEWNVKSDRLKMKLSLEFKVAPDIVFTEAMDTVLDRIIGTGDKAFPENVETWLKEVKYAGVDY